MNECDRGVNNYRLADTTWTEKEGSVWKLGVAVLVLLVIVRGCEVAATAARVAAA